MDAAARAAGIFLESRDVMRKKSPLETE